MTSPPRRPDGGRRIAASRRATCHLPSESKKVSVIKSGANVPWAGTSPADDCFEDGPRLLNWQRGPSGLAYYFGTALGRCSLR